MWAPSPRTEKFTSTSLQQHPEEPLNSIMAAVKKYKDDLTDSDNLALETEMEVWKQYW